MKDFLTYKDQTISFSEFDILVENLIFKFNHFKELDDFVIIKEENPISFYTLLFALWKCDKKVVFPNRDFFNGESFSFVSHIITSENIMKNIGYSKLENIEGDTVLFSSGSTGKPKGIVHSKEHFFINADYVLKKLEIQNIISITPLKPYLVSALSHFLVHKKSDSHLIFIDIDELSDVESYAMKYEQLSYVGSPMHILSMMPFMKNSNTQMFFSSGDIFYSSAIEELLKKYPKATFFNVYGMAEVGGRIFINRISPKTDIRLYKSIGQNIERIEVSIENNEVYIKSDILFYGYIRNGVFEKRDNEKFATGDKVLFKNGFYEFYGRNNDEIKVAGNKISLKYIEQQIAAILGKDFTPIVVTQQHKILGNLIVLVLYTKQSISKIRLLQILRENMNSYELPHKIYQTLSIPYTQTMKIDRKEILNSLNSLEELK